MLTYRLLTLLSRPLLRLAFRPQVSGRERVPAAGGLVLAANHLSGFDSWAIGYPLGARPLRNMGKNELFRHPLLGPLVRRLGVFPARAEGTTAGGVTTATTLAAGGEAVMIFPEGARRRGQEHRPRNGAAHTALAAGVPLVPAAVRGTDGWRHLRRWRIAFGAPVPLDDLRGLEPSAAAPEATRRLWQAVVDLEGDLEATAADNRERRRR